MRVFEFVQVNWLVEKVEWTDFIGWKSSFDWLKKRMEEIDWMKNIKSYLLDWNDRIGWFDWLYKKEIVHLNLGMIALWLWFCESVFVERNLLNVCAICKICMQLYWKLYMCNCCVHFAPVVTVFYQTEIIVHIKSMLYSYIYSYIETAC